MKKLLSMLLVIVMIGNISLSSTAISNDLQREDFPYPTGFILDEMAINNIDPPQTRLYNPPSVDLSADAAFPPIINQRGNSCTTYATTYYQFTYMVNDYYNRDGSLPSNQYSPKWQYTVLAGGTIQDPALGNIETNWGGTSFPRCFDFLDNHGALTWADFPHTASNTHLWPTASKQDKVREALNVRLGKWAGGKNYATFQIDSRGTPITFNESEVLDDVKCLLSLGYIMTVSVVSDAINKTQFDYQNGEVRLASNSGAHGGEKVWCRAYSGSAFHAMTVVGYDDNIWVDLNKDNVVQYGEQGAFKLANSWGTDFGNDGFIWVLYDALNDVSSVSGWETGMHGTRTPALSSTGRFSTFYRISVEEKNPNLIVQTSIASATMGVEVIELRRQPTNSSQSYTELAEDVILIPKDSFNGYMMYDYGSGCSPISSYLNGYCWGAYSPSLRGAKLIDNLGTTIKTMSHSGNRYYKAELNCQLGDVDYSGTLTTTDSTEISKYVAGTAIPSNLQKHLADYNGDGVVNTTDARLVLLAVS